MRVVVPAGPLEAALNALSKQTGLKLAYPTDMTEARNTRGVDGDFRPIEALSRVLAGTGLTYLPAGDATITLIDPRFVRLDTTSEAATTLEEINVEGRGDEAGAPPPTGVVGRPPAPYAGGQVASGARLGMLGNRSVFDTPFNIAGYTDKLIRDQQAQGLIDVIENDPSVRAASSLSDAPGSTLYVRGFELYPLDVGFDGLFGVTDIRRPPLYNIERVEVLKGPSTLVNGGAPNGGVGGAINLIPKRAADEPLTRITPFFHSKGTFGTAVDVGRRFGANGEWGVRLNGVLQRGETSVDKEKLDLGFGSIGLDYRGERVRWSVDFAYQDSDYDRNRTFIEWFPTNPADKIPDAPKLSKNLGRPDEFQRMKTLMGATRFEYDLTENTTVFAGFGVADTSENAFASYKTITSEAGDFSNLFVRRVTDYRTYAADMGVRTQFDTGPIKHEASISAAGFWTKTDFPEALQFLPGGSGNLDNPGGVTVPGYTDDSNGARFNSQDYRSVGIADTMSILHGRVSLTLGGRVQELAAKNYNFRQGGANYDELASKYRESEFTPAVALVVKPVENLSVYGNYVEALISPAAPAGALPGPSLPPLVAKQREVGVKYDFGSFGASVALFDIKRPNAGFVGGAFAADGFKRNRGVEVNLFGEPTPGLRLTGGVSFIRGKLQDTATGDADGNVAPAVPSFALNLYGEYDLPPSLLDGLTVTGRMIHTSKQYYDNNNDYSIPAWTRFDAGLRYSFDGSWGKPVTLRANVVNVFGKDYWSSTGVGLLSLGSPRTLLVSAQFDF
ncbi:TonB-dependent siderophore receptor [Methylopila henanensis]|uniref:TonB-dependent siderophore receptor n=1 Tax=Methylopila henanensis TaxID=873516 RepID=A0ABW4KCX4_9HYPH